MKLNECLQECILNDSKIVTYVNEYSVKYRGLSVDDIMEKLNENIEYSNLVKRNNELRDIIGELITSSKIYLSGKESKEGFLIDLALVKKDNSYALYIYDSVDELDNNTTYIEITYNDLKDYLKVNKEIKRVIFNKNSVNVVIGKSNFLRGNMYGLIIKNNLELI